MILFPAIDLKNGECVRLKLGEMDSATVYNPDPADQARAFEAQGFEWLHVVDLDGAFAGDSRNGEAVEAILGATRNPVQLGGGIRNLAQIEAWLTKGIRRVILGTVAVRDPELVKEACRLFPGRIAVGIDARAGQAEVGERFARSTGARGNDAERATVEIEQGFAGLRGEDDGVVG